MGLLQDVISAGGTGGLNWHLHAYQSSQRWQPTVAHIAYFLTQCKPRHSHLLLLGCSAGWMMPTHWLTQFSHIDAYDIDPLAQRLFNWRHRRVLQASNTQITHHRQDAMVNLPAILARHPHASIWFDNMLGQHRYRIRDEMRVERELRGLKDILLGRDWGSIHDILSGPTTPWVAQDRRHEDVRRNVLAKDVAPISHQLWVQSLHAQGVWYDHLTAGVFADDVLTTLIPWEFRPNYWHWLQAGWQNTTH